MRTLVSFAVVISISTTALGQVSDAVLQAEQERIEAIARASAAAVAVFGPAGGGGGSGVVISRDGFALTNYHVSKPSGDWMKCSMNNGELYDAVIVGIDPTGDVALIKLLPPEDAADDFAFTMADLGNSDEVRVGDWCFAVGNPFLLATNFEPTVSYGIVSGVHRYQYPAGTLLEYADCIQTDAAINPGNSGGPLFNARGQVIGINGRGSFEKRGRVNVGVGYAISINQIKNFLGYLHSGRIVDHATLGATVSTDDTGRVIVTNILQSSDAYRRGLRYNDEIISFGGRPITTTNAFKNVLGIFPKGWKVRLSYRRGDERKDILVRLAGVHSSEELLAKIQGAPKTPQKPGRDGDQDKPGDQEKPGEKPADKQEDKPGDEQEDKKPKPIPLPQQFHKKKPPTPAAVKKLIKSRSGYSNYYFNEQNRDRVWNALVARGDFATATGDWTISATTAGEQSVSFTLRDEQSTAQFPAKDWAIDATKDLGAQAFPDGSGGLLVAMHLWRRFLVVGPEKFGATYYLGTVPVANAAQNHDVLIGTFGVSESWLVFDPTAGTLSAMEVFLDVDVDPCEILFADYRDVDGRALPHRITVRHGDRVFGEYEIKSYSLSSGDKKET